MWLELAATMQPDVYHLVHVHIVVPKLFHPSNIIKIFECGNYQILIRS